nr:pentatricopeptide repeat-containing protein [Tanacetum cinerariifolium]GEX72554.1 pentatricopeptide repeat-containing protein [Tanacetum cinerariifolium]
MYHFQTTHLEVILSYLVLLIYGVTPPDPYSAVTQLRGVTSITTTWVDIIRKNVFCLGGNRDHVLMCLCHMLYCITRSEPYNLAFFIAKRMDFVTKQARLILSYGMLLTRLFKHLMFENRELSNDNYDLYDRVICLLIAQQERKTQKDYGMKRGCPSISTSSSFAFGQPSSSHHIDEDNDGNDRGLERLLTVGNKMDKAFPLPGESSHWQYKFPLPVEGVPTARRMEIPLPGVCTAMMKKLPVKDKWQLH